VVTELFVAAARSRMAGSGHAVFVALGNFFEREIFLRFVDTRLRIPVVVYVLGGRGAALANAHPDCFVAASCESVVAIL
jgi:hypothetical protein